MLNIGVSTEFMPHGAESGLLVAFFDKDTNSFANPQERGEVGDSRISDAPGCSVATCPHARPEASHGVSLYYASPTLRGGR